MKKILYYLTLIFSLTIFGSSTHVNAELDNQLNTKESQNQQEKEEKTDHYSEQLLDEDGVYTDPFQVAKYLRTFGKLPNNYMSKQSALNFGLFNNRENSTYLSYPLSIGGDLFYNKEERLETASGRVYYECDVNYEGGTRGAERLIYSNDGLIYYTNDHYETFHLLMNDDDVKNSNQVS